MKSNSFAATPYLSDYPLSQLTEWLAIKVTICGKSTNYSSALAKVKEISEKLTTVSEQASSEICRFVPAEETYEDLAPSLSLEKSNAEHGATLVKHIVLELVEEVDFWQKMEAVTQFIDEISQYCDQFKLDKLVDIKIGCDSHTPAMV